ncbi:hypothetical protein Tco_0103573, partial [Tanacetum coccineum]
IMADVNAPIEQAPAVAPPTRTDEQILPRIRWFTNDISTEEGTPRHSLIRCLTGRLSGFERPRAPLLQILGRNQRDHICVMRKGFGKNSLNPSIPFTKTKESGTTHSCGGGRKKQATPHSDQVTASLGISQIKECLDAKSNELITDDIRGADYYDAYLKKVAKPTKISCSEEVSDTLTLLAPKSLNLPNPRITKQANPVAPKHEPRNPPGPNQAVRRINVKQNKRKPLKHIRGMPTSKAGRWQRMRNPLRDLSTGAE